MNNSKDIVIEKLHKLFGENVYIKNAPAGLIVQVFGQKETPDELYDMMSAEDKKEIRRFLVYADGEQFTETGTLAITACDKSSGTIEIQRNEKDANVLLRRADIEASMAYKLKEFEAKAETEKDYKKIKNGMGEFPAFKDIVINGIAWGVSGIRIKDEKERIFVIEI